MGRSAPKFSVDLDEAPEDRWKEVILYYRSRGILKAHIDNAEHNGMSPEVEEEWYQTLRPQVSVDIVREMHGWMKYGDDPRITERSIVLSNLLYELNSPSYCSGLIAAVPNGTVIHGRDMDYRTELDVNGTKLGWPEVTLEVTFLRRGKPLYVAVTWPLAIGIHSAMRFDGWTLEQNTRRFKRDMEENLAAAKAGGVSLTIFARQAMETIPDFETAVQTIKSQAFAAQQYIIMAGPGPYQGVVLSVDRKKVKDPTTPKERWLSEKRARWYLLQTNDDANKLPPIADPRRPLEEYKLSHLLQDDVSVDFVAREMRTLPLRDTKDMAAVFTWIAVVASGYSKIVLPKAGEAEEQLRALQSKVEPLPQANWKTAESKPQSSSLVMLMASEAASQATDLVQTFSSAVEEVAQVLMRRGRSADTALARGDTWLP